MHFHSIHASTTNPIMKLSSLVWLWLVFAVLKTSCSDAIDLPAPTPGVGTSTSPTMSPALSPTGASLPSIQQLPVGQPPQLSYVATQGNVSSFVAATNETSSLPLAYAAGSNNTYIPGIGRVLLPTPQPREVLPPTLLSPWYDFMTQPAISDGISYMSTMQAPHFWGTILDRGPYDVTIRSSDVQQGYVSDCALGASIIALAEAGRFGHSTFPVGIAENAPRPYFDVTLYIAPGQLQTQHIDDLLPADIDNNAFFGYAPTPDAVDTPVTSTNANAVLVVPYIEKGFAKLLDFNPDLKTDSTLLGYAGLTGISPAVVLTGLTGEPSVSFDYRTYQNWDFEVFSLVTSTSPVVFGTPDTLDDFLTMGDNSLPEGQTVGFDDNDFMVWRTIDSKDYISYFVTSGADTGPEYVFVADHAYGLMRGQYTSDTTATLRNPWGVNPDHNGELTLPATITISITVLQRVMLVMYRG